MVEFYLKSLKDLKKPRELKNLREQKNIREQKKTTLINRQKNTNTK
jgi:hypothetical protein